MFAARPTQTRSFAPRIPVRATKSSLVSIPTQCLTLNVSVNFLGWARARQLYELETREQRHRRRPANAHVVLERRDLRLHRKPISPLARRLRRTAHAPCDLCIAVSGRAIAPRSWSHASDLLGGTRQHGAGAPDEDSGFTARLALYRVVDRFAWSVYNE